MFTETDKKVLQTGLVMAGILAFALLYYTFIMVKPQVQNDRKEAQKKRDEKKKLDEELAQLQEYKGKEAEIAAFIQQLYKEVERIPQAKEALEFSRIIEDSIRMTNVDYTGMLPQKSIPRGAYEEIAYLIDGRARYHDFGQFLAVIEQHKNRIMRIRKLTVTSDPAKSPARHKLSVEVATYYFTETLPSLDKKEVASR